MIPKQIIKSCLSNVIKSCKRYKVSFVKLLIEILCDQLRKEYYERRSIRRRH